MRQSYRWLARYRAEGAAGLGDRSSAPHHCQHRTPGDRVGDIERLRRQRMSGSQTAGQLGMPVSTAGGILRRLGLNRLAALDEKPAVVRYQREQSRRVIYSDITERKRSEAEIKAARDAAEAAYRDLQAAQRSKLSKRNHTVKA